MIDFDTQQVILSTQKQLLNLWFAVFLLRGMDREEAARKSHQQAMEYLREAGMGETQIPLVILSEEAWVRTMMIRVEGML